MKVSDYIVDTLVRHGTRHVFMVTGGGAMHLNDSFGKDTRLEYVCHHHEQACAIAAEGYARVSGKTGVVCVTTGPGGTNALTGVLGQWLDSIPAIYISGQVRTQLTVAHTGLPLRQLGDQEADIISIVKPITKYAVEVTDPQSIRYHLEKAMYLAREGRPGPVWLDVPLDVQAAVVDESTLRPYDSSADRVEFDASLIEKQVAEILGRIRTAERPVVLAGAGIRLADACNIFHDVAARLKIPVLAAWDAIDIIPSDHPCYFGRPSTLGQRAANFIFQNADLLLSIGCRLNTRQIGYSFASVARAACKVIVDIDPVELQKPTIKPDIPVHCDARLFLEIMHRQLTAEPMSAKPAWLDWCAVRRDRYPVVEHECRKTTDLVNPYVFCDVLSDCLKDDDVVVSANGAACVVPIQAMRLRAGQRHIVNSGCAAMGYGLPAAIGACFARDKKRIVCLEGDGSIQMNLQELQTIVHHNLSIKLFIFDNDGYQSIRSTQRAYFDGHFVGESRRSGISFPKMLEIARAYGIPGVEIAGHAELSETIRAALERPGPVICNVRMCPEQGIVPRVASQRLPNGQMMSKPLEDMYPFLDREELRSNMIIPLWESP